MTLSAPTSPSDRLAEFFAHLDRCESKQDLTHGLHPYPAKFIPHIPRELILAYSAPGDLVWDPMCGSGTTLVEAAVAGRNAIGTDINPIAILASRAKTTALNRRARDELRGLLLELRVASRLWPGGRPDEQPILPEFRNRDHWFEPHVAHELGLLDGAIERIGSDAARNLARCALSAILVGVSNQEGETRWRARPPALGAGAVRTRFLLKLRSSLDAVEEYGGEATGRVAAGRHDVRDEAAFRRPVDLIVTSPPYANSHDYYLYNKLRMFWLGEPVKPVKEAEIGSHNRHSDRGEGIDAYLDALGRALGRMRSALKPGGRIAMVIADGVIRGELHRMGELIPPLAATGGLRSEQRFSFDHRRFNTGLHRGFATASSEKQTHVLVMSKPGPGAGDD